MYDADAKLAEFEPPQIKIGGELFTGRPLSIVETPRFAKRLNDMLPRLDAEDADAAALMEEFAVLARDVCEAMGFPAEKVLTLPPEMIIEVLTSFFGRQTRRPAPPRVPPEPAPSPTPSSA